MNNRNPLTDLEKLDALHAAATQGEWSPDITVIHGSEYGCSGVKTDHPDGCEVARGAYSEQVCQTVHGFRVDGQQRLNMECIAALHNAYPAMAAELRALRARVAELEAKWQREECAHCGERPQGYQGTIWQDQDRDARMKALGAAEWIKNAAQTMRKRVRDIQDGVEIADGAVPVWWMKEEAARLRQESEAKNG